MLTVASIENRGEDFKGALVLYHYNDRDSLMKQHVIGQHLDIEEHNVITQNPYVTYKSEPLGTRCRLLSFERENNRYKVEIAWKRYNSGGLDVMYFYVEPKGYDIIRQWFAER